MLVTNFIGTLFVVLVANQYDEYYSTTAESFAVTSLSNAPVGYEIEQEVITELSAVKLYVLYSMHKKLRYVHPLVPQNCSCDVTPRTPALSSSPKRQSHLFLLLLFNIQRVYYVVEKILIS